MKGYCMKKSFIYQITEDEFRKLYIDELLTYKEIAEKYNTTARSVESANQRYFKIYRTKEQQKESDKKHCKRIKPSSFI